MFLSLRRIRTNQHSQINDYMHLFIYITISHLVYNLSFNLSHYKKENKQWNIKSWLIMHYQEHKTQHIETNQSIQLHSWVYINEINTLQAHDHELLPLTAILNAELLAKLTFPKYQTPLLRFMNEIKSNQVITNKIRSLRLISFLNDIWNVVFSMPPNLGSKYFLKKLTYYSNYRY